MPIKSAPPDAIIASTISQDVLIRKWMRKEDGMMRYFVGDDVKISYNITVLDVYTDPANPTVTVLAPTGARTVYTPADPELTALGVGMYEFVLDVTAAGEWIVAWQGDAPAKGVTESRIYARESQAL